MTLTGFPALGAVADALPTDPPETTRALDAKGQRKADALAWFVNGLFEEESDGPEKALESYRKALALDPANTDLAIKVAYDYLRRGETADAISVLKDAVKAAPKEIAPYLALSATYLRHLQKPDLAVKYRADSDRDCAEVVRSLRGPLGGLSFRRADHQGRPGSGKSGSLQE